MRIWDPHSGESRLTLRGHNHESVVTACAISPTGEWIAAVGGTNDGTLRVWSSRKGEPLRVIEVDEQGLSGCGISPDGELILTLGGAKKLFGPEPPTRIFAAQSSEQLCELPKAFTWAFAPDSSLVVFGYGDGSLAIRDPRTGAVLRTLDYRKAGFGT